MVKDCDRGNTTPVGRPVVPLSSMSDVTVPPEEVNGVDPLPSKYTVSVRKSVHKLSLTIPKLVPPLRSAALKRAVALSPVTNT